MVVVSDLIKSIHYMKIGQKTTICLITLDNGFEIVGTSSCANPIDFDYEVGKKYAKEDALNKLKQIEGFILNEHVYLAMNKMLEGRGNESLQDL